MNKKVMIAVVVAAVFSAILLMVLRMTSAKAATVDKNWMIIQWTTIVSEKGEKIYDGPSEYIDDQVELDELDKSKYNWIWNSESKQFDRIERGSIFKE